jgi:hypothetical protein
MTHVQMALINPANSPIKHPNFVTSQRSISSFSTSGSLKAHVGHSDVLPGTCGAQYHGRQFEARLGLYNDLPLSHVLANLLSVTCFTWKTSLLGSRLTAKPESPTSSNAPPSTLRLAGSPLRQERCTASNLYSTENLRTSCQKFSVNWSNRTRDFAVQGVVSVDGVECDNHIMLDAYSYPDRPSAVGVFYARTSDYTRRDFMFSAIEVTGKVPSFVST